MTRQQLTNALGGPGNRSLGRIALDLAMLGGLGWVACSTSWALVRWVTVLCIGAVPMHDILVHGHEATHRLISRSRVVNDVCLWFTHALVGMSGTGYRAFHLEHHARTNRPDDPEIVFYGGGRGSPGVWDYLRIPFLSHWLVNTYPWTHDTRHATRAEVARELLLAGTAHAGLAMAIGVRAWCLSFVVPLAGLSCVYVLRSLCEHHGTRNDSRWGRTRALVTSPLVDFLWSNVSHHLEHHLCPTIPYYHLPAVRRSLAAEYERQGSIMDHGYLKTSWRLFRTPRQTIVNPQSLAYRFKVRWFKDILSNDETRQYLWSLYYAGEAYEELHPDGMLAHKLPEPERHLWMRQMRDENRHAGLFRRLLNHDPEALPQDHDLAWYLLTHILPDVVQKVQTPGEFERTDLVRYMAFLHSLELRSIFDLCAMRTAAEQLGMANVVETVTDILQDERFHAAYCHKAVRKYSDNPRSIFRDIQRQEQRFYTQAMNHILDRMQVASTNRLRWAMLRVLARLGLAFPRLPMYDRLPSRLI